MLLWLDLWEWELAENNTLNFAILNLTPDSFSDGSEHNLDTNYSTLKAISLQKMGADVLDIGAESTRPGAETLSPNEEFARLKPFLEAYSGDLPLSIDTRKPAVVREMASYKINYINDVTGLQADPDMAKAIAQLDNCQVIVMHSSGQIPSPASSEIKDDFYDDLYDHMLGFFTKSIEIAERAGIDKSALILDPGLGFAKNLKQSFAILNYLPKLREHFGLPILIGASRKSFLKQISKDSNLAGFESQWDYAEDLDLATKAYNQLAYKHGARYFRVHNPGLAPNHL